MRRVIHSMGIPISIDIPECQDDKVFAECLQRLTHIDERFSTYKSDSEVSRYNQGDVPVPSNEFAAVMNACATYQSSTDDYFSAYYNDTYDPTGYVKGWAIHEVGKIIQKNGYQTYLINAAGDIEAASDGDKTWQLAIQHPFDRSQTIASLSIKNGALATSGTYERGLHIFNPHTKQAASGIRSASVWGPDIITADVFATAIIAMGTQNAIDFMSRQTGYHCLFVEQDGTVRQT